MYSVSNFNEGDLEGKLEGFKRSDSDKKNINSPTSPNLRTLP